MRLWLAAVLLLIPGVAACQDGPVIEIDLPPFTGCEAPCAALVPDTERHFEGVVRWTWWADQCTPETGLAQEDVEIRLGFGAAGDDFVAARLAPETVRVPLTEFYDVTGAGLDDGELKRQGEIPFEVWFTAPAHINSTVQDHLAERGGVAYHWIIARVEGEGILEDFTVQQVALDMSYVPTEAEAAPAQDAQAAAPLALIPLAVAALARRR